MKHILRFGFVLSFCALTSLAHAAPTKKAASETPPAAKAEPPLEAELTVTPIELSPESTIEVIFPTPMVAKERIGTTEAEAPVVVTPALAGSFQWTSTRSGHYRLTEAPKFNASYDFKLRSGLKDLTGRSLATDDLASVTSASFRLIDQYPKWFDTDSARRTPLFLFEFNDNVVPENAAKSISFVSESPALTIPARVRHATGKDFKHQGDPGPTWAEEVAKVKPAVAEDATRMSALVVEPQTPLAVATKWKLVITDSLTNASGHDALSNPESIALGDVKPFQVTNITGHTPFDRSYYLDVVFNKSLLPAHEGEWKQEELDAIAAKLAPAVIIEPAVADLKAEVTSGYLRIHGKFALKTPYRVVIDPIISSGDGLPLTHQGGAFEKQITFVPNPPYVAAPAFMRAQLANGQGLFEFTAANVREVRVRAKRLNGSELLQATDKYSKYNSAYHAEEKRRAAFKPERIETYAGTQIYDRTYPVSKALDQSELLKLNWREILAGAPAGPMFIEIEGVAADGLEQKGIITQTLVTFTDLGLMQKSTGRETMVFVTSLKTGKPVAGARLTLVDTEYKLLGYADSDANGLATLKGADPALVLAEKNGDCAVIRCGDSHIGNAVPYDMAIAWDSVWEPNRKTFVFSDRPLYQPGETAHLKALTRVRIGDDLQLDSTPIKAMAKLRDPRYRVIWDKEITFSTSGSWTEDIRLPENLVGWYSLSITPIQNDADRESAENGESFSFRVDEYKPNTFEVSLDDEKLEILPDRLKFPLSAKYYMGKALSRAKVSWNAFSESEFEAPEGFDTYHFGDAPKSSHYGQDRDADGNYADSDEETSEWYVNGDVSLNDDGTAVLEMPKPPADRAALPQQVHLSAEVTDINQQTVSQSVVFEVPGADFLLGLKGPEFFGSVNQDMNLEVVAIDSDGDPAPGQVTVEVKIERQEFHTLKIATAGNGSTTKDQVILREELKQSLNLKAATPDSVPSATVTFKPTRGGSYFITAEATDAAGRKVLSRMPISVVGGGQFPWAMEDGARINLQPENKVLKPGEEGVVVVKTPISGTALVTVERNRIHRTFVTEISPDQPVIKIPVQDAEAPNVFVSVVVIRGSDGSPKQHKMPEYKIGYCQLEVESHLKDLNIAVAPDKPEVKPGEAVTVTATVTDDKAKAVPNSEVTLYAVDEGVLSLMDHETPDPASYFHAEFPLAVDNYTSFGDILPEEFAARERGNKGFVIGGGGDENEVAIPSRKNFVATPLWIATAMTDAQGRVTSTFNAPDNLTRYRIMAVASEGADRFGSGESEFTINKPLMVEPVVPRFARLGDEVLLKAVVHNTTTHSGQVEVSLELDNTASFITEPRFFVPASLKFDAPADGKKQKQTLAIKAGETASVAFPVVFSTIGTAKWNWTVRTTQWPDGAPALNDGTTSTFEVAHPVPELRAVRYARLDSKAPVDNLISSMNPALLEGEGTLTVNLSTSRLSEAADALEYVLTYPYGCAEQTASATLPWLALGGYQNLFPGKLDVAKSKEAVQSGVNKLLQMTTDDGGLGYWPGSAESSLWASSYGGFILLRARDAGANVPPEAIDRLMSYLSKTLRGMDEEKDFYNLTDSALALYTLAKAGRPEPAYQNLLFSRRTTLPETARLYVALAMCLSKTPDQQIKDMIGWTPPAPPAPPKKEAANAKSKNKEKSKTTAKAKDTKPAPARPAPVIWQHWAGSGANKALRLIAYTHLGLTSDAEKLCASILQSRNGRGEWGNTFTNAWTLTALAAYERSLKRTAEPLAAQVVWNSEKSALNLPGEPASTKVSFALNERLASSPLKIELPADREAFSRVDARSFPPQREFAGENKGYAITRTYEKMLPNGDTGPAENLRVGDMVVISLAIEIGGGDRYLAISDPLPGVLEAINPEFESQNARVVEGVEDWFCDHREIRTDRALFFTNFAPDKGKFQLSYLARVVAEGDTIAPPARIEAMYQPEKYGLSPTQHLKTLPSAGGQVADK